jgi:peptidoglycan/xylan/chitin deacetylase (PgdA/CDA1 family)
MVITFDDGYQSVYREGWPRLKALNFTASVFLVSDHCGGTSRWPGQPASVPASPLLAWDEVQALAREGWEFGAHTRTHPPLTTLGQDAIETEVAGSQDTIRERTGQDVTAFAYPYGAVNAGVANVVRRHFATAVTTRLGLVTRGCDPYHLPRIDAYYLDPRHVPSLRSALYRTYLSARQAGRSVRRWFRQDWENGRTPHDDARAL